VCLTWIYRLFSRVEQHPVPRSSSDHLSECNGLPSNAHNTPAHPSSRINDPTHRITRIIYNACYQHPPDHLSQVSPRLRRLPLSIFFDLYHESIHSDRGTIMVLSVGCVLLSFMAERGLRLPNPVCASRLRGQREPSSRCRALNWFL
jgi:hypothetical protein